MEYARAIILLMLSCIGVAAQPLTPSGMEWRVRTESAAQPQESCDLVKPAMTSSNTPAGLATGSTGEFGDLAAPWKAFDENIDVFTGPTDTFSVWNSDCPAYIEYQFPTSQTVRSYSIWTTAELKQPKSWSFSGSTNGTTWELLDSHTNIVWGTTPGLTDNKSYAITNAGSYLFYRMSISEAQGSDQVEMLELELNGCVY